MASGLHVTDRRAPVGAAAARRCASASAAVLRLMPVEVNLVGTLCQRGRLGSQWNANQPEAKTCRLGTAPSHVAPI